MGAGQLFEGGRNSGRGGLLHFIRGKLARGAGVLLGSLLF